MTDADIINRTALKRLLAVIGGDEEDLAELVEDFTESAPALATTITGATQSGDRDAVRIAAHTLKSNARDFGAVHLSKLCEAMERALKEETPESLGWAAEEISAHTAKAVAALSEVSLEDV